MTEEEEREEIYNDVIQQFDYINDFPLSGDQKQEIITDIVELVLTSSGWLTN